MRAKIKGPGNQDEKYDYLAVIDFEATCQENNAMNYKHEIIEFPIVLVDTAQRKIVSTFSFHFFISMPVKAVTDLGGLPPPSGPKFLHFHVFFGKNLVK